MEIKEDLIVKDVLERVSQIYTAERDIISRGLIPEEGPSGYDFYFSKIPNYE